MARKHHALDEPLLRRWIAAGEPVARADGEGLTFTLSDTRAATWILRYSRGSRRREITLGTYPELTLLRRESGPASIGRRLTRVQTRPPTRRSRKRGSVLR